jgi:hypothetical protein
VFVRTNFFQPVTSLDVWTGTLVFMLTIAGMVLTPVGVLLWVRKGVWI